MARPRRPSNEWGGGLYTAGAMVQEEKSMGDGTARGEAGGRRDLTRRDFLLASASAGAGLYLGLGNRGLVSAAGAQPAPPASNLEIFNAGWPRTFFFRQTEYEARDRAISGQAPGSLEFPEWEKRFSPLGGIMGKVLDEEHDFTSVGGQNLNWFKQFKEKNPPRLSSCTTTGQDGGRPTRRRGRTPGSSPGTSSTTAGPASRSRPGRPATLSRCTWRTPPSSE